MAFGATGATIQSAAAGDGPALLTSSADIVITSALLGGAELPAAWTANQANAQAAALPEPTSAVLLVVGGCALRRRRGRMG